MSHDCITNQQGRKPCTCDSLSRKRTAGSEISFFIFVWIIAVLGFCLSVMSGHWTPQ